MSELICMSNVTCIFNSEALKKSNTISELLYNINECYTTFIHDYQSNLSKGLNCIDFHK